MDGALENRVALITGGSRGIGRAIAKTFLREGASVVICGRKQEALDEAVGELGPGVTEVVCNVSRASEIAGMVEAVERKHGRVDILVNNVGTNIAFGPALSFTEAQFDKMIETNLKSAWRLTQALAPGMCERGWGSIINIASVSGLRPQYQSLLYSMTKAALIMMTQSYAVEFGPAGVRVNAIAPGLIQTQMSEYFWKDEESRKKLFGEQPSRRLGQPEDVAEVALLLASDRGGFITGQTLVVDGGLLLP